MASVKFVVDLAAGEQIYLPSAKDYSLHFEFVREVIEQKAPLDRCIPLEQGLFYQGWYDFSVAEYFKPTGRHYLLGTLTHHAATDLYTVEFALGDTIAPADMRKAFFAATAHVLEPERYFLRPQDDIQTAKAIQIEGSLPIVSTNAPFIGVKWQPLSAGVGYGILTYIRAADLPSAQLGPDVIVVTDDVPNDLPLVGGLVTEAFQTPLSHVNVLCQNRGTPNLGLPSAGEISPVADLLGKLVRFEVTSDAYRISPASPEEARAFWESRYSGDRLIPRLDSGPTEIANLEESSLADLPSIGAKAAQLAELVSLSHSYAPTCTNARKFTVPTPAFAIPVSHFDAHFHRSGARALLLALLQDDEALTNRAIRRTKLEEIRAAIANTPIDADLLARVTSLLENHFGVRPVRFRSSSNAEDLPNFNGAGLYTSASAILGDSKKTVEAAIHEVWSSLYRDRAFDERELLHVDHTKVAMGVLIHPAFVEERANGVIVTRDVRDIVRGDIFTFNAQAGEASVTNPAPGVTSDEFIYRLPPRTPPITEYSRSSLGLGQSVMSQAEVEDAACAAQAVVNHFSPLLDPEQRNAYFTMDMEFKLLGANRTLLLKQARPYSFGSWEDPGDCRQF
ncbi:MAG: PEP/pyruvate-binding domain-containing protein [Polyangiaceae bacterium]